MRFFKRATPKMVIRNGITFVQLPDRLTTERAEQVRREWLKQYQRSGTKR